MILYKAILDALCNFYYPHNHLKKEAGKREIISDSYKCYTNCKQLLRGKILPCKVIC